MNRRIIVTTCLPDDPVKILRAHDAAREAEIVYLDQKRTATREELLSAVPGANAILSQIPDHIDAEVLEAATDSLRVVADSLGRMPMKARMLSEPGESLIVVGPNARISAINADRVNVSVKEFPLKEGRIDLQALLENLATERNVTSIMAEGGGRLLGSLFDRGLVDKVVAFVAPTIVGGTDASSPVSGLGAETMLDALELHRVRWKRLGRDMAIIGYC